MHFFKKFYIILFILIPAIVIITFWNLPGIHWNINMTDYKNFYFPVGQNIAEGNGVYLNGKLASRYPPGYPIIISGLILISKSFSIPYIWILKMAILLSWSFSFFLVFKIFRFFISKKLAFLSALLWLIYPFNLWITRSPLSENFFIPLFYLSVFLLIYLIHNHKTNFRSKLLISLFVGFTLGLTVLIRPIIVGIPIVYVFIIFIFLKKALSRYQLLSLSFALIGSFILTIFPWQYELNKHYHTFKLLSSGGFVSVRDGLTNFVETKGYRDTLKVNQFLKKLSKEALVRKKEGELENYTDIINFYSEQFKNNKLGIISLIYTKSLRSWYGLDSQNRKLEFYNKIIQLIYILLVSVGIYTALYKLMFKKLKLWIIIIGLLVIYNWAMTILVLSILRYMTPTISLLSVFVAISLFYFYRKSSIIISKFSTIKHLF